jgi:hypothetical protein
MYAYFISSFIVSDIVSEDLAVDDVFLNCGEVLVVDDSFNFGECEFEGAIGGFTGPGLSSTLCLGGMGGIV